MKSISQPVTPINVYSSKSLMRWKKTIEEFTANIEDANRFASQYGVPGRSIDCNDVFRSLDLAEKTMYCFADEVRDTVLIDGPDRSLYLTMDQLLTETKISTFKVLDSKLRVKPEGVSA